MKLTNKQLRQIIKEELEAVMGEELSGRDLEIYNTAKRKRDAELEREVLDGPVKKLARKVDYDTLSSMGDMGEERDFIYLRDNPNTYLHIESSSGGERVGTLFFNDGGTVYNTHNQRPLAETRATIEGLEKIGFTGSTIQRKPGASHGGSTYY